MERAEYQMSGESRANGNFGCLEVADFPDHDDIRVLAENVAQAHREGQANVRPDRNLIDALQLIFDRLFDGDDPLLHRVDGAQKGVEGRGFARAGRTGHQHDPVRLNDDFANRCFLLLGKTKLFEAEKDLSASQQTERYAFTINSRNR